MNHTIDQLPSGGPVDATDRLIISDSGVAKRVTALQLKNYILAGVPIPTLEEVLATDNTSGAHNIVFDANFGLESNDDIDNKQRVAFTSPGEDPAGVVLLSNDEANANASNVFVGVDRVRVESADQFSNTSKLTVVPDSINLDTTLFDLKMGGTTFIYGNPSNLEIGPAFKMVAQYDAIRFFSPGAGSPEVLIELTDNLINLQKTTQIYGSAGDPYALEVAGHALIAGDLNVGGALNFQKTGATTFTFNGTQTVFEITHGLGSNPTSFSLTFSDGRNVNFNQSVRTKSSTKLTITCDSAPTGSAITVYWQVFK